MLWLIYTCRGCNQLNTTAAQCRLWQDACSSTLPFVGSGCGAFGLGLAQRGPSTTRSSPFQSGRAKNLPLANHRRPTAATTREPACYLSLRRPWGLPPHSGALIVALRCGAPRPIGQPAGRLKEPLTTKDTAWHVHRAVRNSHPLAKKRDSTIGEHRGVRDVPSSGGIGGGLLGSGGTGETGMLAASFGGGCGHSAMYAVRALLSRPPSLLPRRPTASPSMAATMQKSVLTCLHPQSLPSTLHPPQQEHEPPHIACKTMTPTQRMSPSLRPNLPANLQ